MFLAERQQLNSVRDGSSPRRDVATKRGAFLYNQSCCFQSVELTPRESSGALLPLAAPATAA